MNEFHAMAVFENGAWRAKVRYCHRSGYACVMDGDQAASFDTKDAAEIAALREQERHINGTLRRDGETIAAAKAVADSHFKLKRGGSETIYRGHGKKPLLTLKGSAG